MRNVCAGAPEGPGAIGATGVEESEFEGGAFGAKWRIHGVMGDWVGPEIKGSKINIENISKDLSLSFLLKTDNQFYFVYALP